MAFDEGEAVHSRETETTEGCGQCPGGGRAAFYTEGSGLSGRSHPGEPSRARLCERLGEDPWLGNSKCKRPGAGKNPFETQIGTTRAGICPGRNDAAIGVGRLHL